MGAERLQKTEQKHFPTRILYPVQTSFKNDHNRVKVLNATGLYLRKKSMKW